MSPWKQPPRGTYHKSNPSSVLQGYVASYSTLTQVMWKVATGAEGDPNEGYYDTQWLKELWSTQA